MRYTIIIFIISLIAVSCGKDKYTSAPQIKYKSISPNTVFRGVIIGSPQIPVITINITDAEGDLSFVTGKDSAYVVIKSIINNIVYSKIDSFKMPDIGSITNKNFQADIRINIFDFLRGSLPSPPRGMADTLYYEIFVVDNAKNKSNVITTGDPIFYVTP